MSKLWSKGYELEDLIEDFTVGEDYILDQRLIPADVLGSLSHAEMLSAVGLLNNRQLATLRSGLLSILDEHEAGDFDIRRSDEDGHTAIENRLVELIGEDGKRLHLGRSRNDQILTVMRIWMREFLFHFIASAASLASDLLDFAETHRQVPMPGRTHMRPAMPSSVGLWAGGFAELIVDDLCRADSLYPYLDQCPLGSGAGFGTPLPLDRELSAHLLGFSRVQMNTAYCGLSRGKFESHLLDVLDQTAISLSKFAHDLVQFSMPEFAWFTLPQELCSGSSIMPQKRNPDALELMRSRAASVGAWSQQVKTIIRSLPSGYNRDYQDTKEPTLRGADTLMSMIAVTALTVSKLKVNEAALIQAFDPGIFATDAAIALVAEGMSFRDAYREVATHPAKYSAGGPREAIENRTSSGTAGNLRLDLARNTLEGLRRVNMERKQSVYAALERLAGRQVRVLC